MPEGTLRDWIAW